MEPPADLSTRYSHPQWLVDSFVARLGREEAEALLAADNGEPPTCAQVNTLKISAEELAAMLTAEGVAVEPHPWLPDCLFLNGTGRSGTPGGVPEGVLLHPGCRRPSGGAGRRAAAGVEGAGRLCSPWRQILRRRYRHGEPGERHLL